MSDETENVFELLHQIIILSLLSEGDAVTEIKGPSDFRDNLIKRLSEIRVKSLKIEGIVREFKKDVQELKQLCQRHESS